MFLIRSDTIACGIDAEPYLLSVAGWNFLLTEGVPSYIHLFLYDLLSIERD